jgi:hypothetical protein
MWVSLTFGRFPSAPTPAPALVQFAHSIDAASLVPGWGTRASSPREHMAKGGSVRWLWAGFTEVLSGEPWVMGDAFFFSVFLFSELLDTQQERCSFFFLQEQ